MENCDAIWSCRVSWMVNILHSVESRANHLTFLLPPLKGKHHCRSGPQIVNYVRPARFDDRIGQNIIFHWYWTLAYCGHTRRTTKLHWFPSAWCKSSKQNLSRHAILFIKDFRTVENRVEQELVRKHIRVFNFKAPLSAKADVRPVFYTLFIDLLTTWSGTGHSINLMTPSSKVYTVKRSFLILILLELVMVTTCLFKQSKLRLEERSN